LGYILGDFLQTHLVTLAINGDNETVSYKDAEEFIQGGQMRL
jgi:hypothetical protein